MREKTCEEIRSETVKEAVEKAEEQAGAEERGKAVRKAARKAERKEASQESRLEIGRNGRIRGWGTLRVGDIRWRRGKRGGMKREERRQ